jgi:replicative DNA helicase/ribosomal protein S10
MSDIDVKKFLTDRGFKNIISKGDNWNIDCPFCGDTKQRLGFNKATGFANCFNCGYKSRKLKNFDYKYKVDVKGEEPKTTKVEKVKVQTKVKIKKKLDQELADKCHSRIDSPKRKALRYLRRERGFSRVTIDKFKLGSAAIRGKEFITIPFYLDSKLVDIKYRAINPDQVRSKWVRYGGVGNFIYNNEILATPKKGHLFIVEAELDLIALVNAGIKNVISLTNGAKSFPEEFYAQIAEFKKIYICLDNDEDGQYGAEKLAKRLGINKCYNIVLPEEVKDINEYFWDNEEKKPRHSLDDFKALAKKAERFKVKGVMSSKEILYNLNRDIRLGGEDKIDGIPTQWARLNQLLGGGFKAGELVVVAAKPKIGKSTLCINLLNYLDMVQEEPSFFISCEMNSTRISQTLVRMNNPTFTTYEDITPTDVARTFNRMNGKLHVYYPTPADLNIENMCDKIRDTVQMHGCKIVVFDNLLFLARGQNVSEQVGQVTRSFKMLAEELGITIILVTHPRKTNHDNPLTPDDLKDSSSIFQDLDVLILLHRAALKAEIDEDSLENDDDEVAFETGNLDSLTEVQVISRYAEGGRAYLNFNSHRGLFKDYGDGFREAMTKKKEEINRKRKNRSNRDADRKSKRY